MMLPKRKALSLSTVLVPQLFVAGMAAAQPSTTPSDQPTSEAAQPAAEVAAAPGTRRVEEEIVVTGSRIRRKDLTTPAPIAVINRDMIQASGRITIGDFLQALPE